MSQLWKEEEEINVKGEVLQGNGMKRKISRTMRNCIIEFLWYNEPSMEKWVEEFDIIWIERENNRKQFRRSHPPTHVPFPSTPYYESLPKKCNTYWLSRLIKEAKVKNHNLKLSKEEI